jgi:alkanesulfonate monooxygenase SsuD/methylene tetrahydromethanopterin reductase-like flavin-dependent oxidoreductase (luciferase family)
VILDVQVNPARHRWGDVRAFAQAAEAGGYGALWTFDHLAGATLRGDSMLEAFTLLGAVAATTERIELGTMVANVHNRTPALLAVAAATLAAIGARRVHLGVGAGGSPSSRFSEEMHAIGQHVEPTLAGRHARLVEALDVLERMFATPRDDGLATFPQPQPRPTVLVGVSGPTLAALAGRRADGINVPWAHPRRDELLDVALAARGERRDDFVVTAWTTWSPELLDPTHPEREAMAARGLHRLVLVIPAGVGPEDLAQRA